MPGTSPLSPEQRALLQQTITAELRRVWDDAVAAGVPAERLAEIVDRRRQELLSAIAGGVAADDRHYGGDNPVDDDRVAD